jgi:hypothetical protein
VIRRLRARTLACAGATHAHLVRSLLRGAELGDRDSEHEQPEREATAASTAPSDRVASIPKAERSAASASARA